MVEKEPLLATGEPLSDGLDEDSPAMEYIPSWLTMRFLTLMGAGLLFTAAFLSISFLSLVYFVAGFLYLSLSFNPAMNTCLILYADLVAILKVVGIFVTFNTDTFAGLSPLGKDTYAALGFTFLDKRILHCFLSVGSDLTATFALLITRKVLRDIENAPKPEGGQGSIWIEVWTCLAVGFMAMAYVLGESTMYVLVTGIMIAILWLWASTVAVPKSILMRKTLVIYVVIPLLCVLQYVAQTPLVTYLPDKTASILGLSPIRTFKGWAAFVSLNGIYLCAAFCKDTFVEAIPDSIPAGVGQLREVVAEKPGKPKNMRTCWETIKDWATYYWKRSTLTPFGLTHIIRVLAILWVTKYNTIEDVPILLWLYYSAWYSDARLFAKYSFYLIGPFVALQIIGCKVVAIPQLLTGRWEDVKYLANYGFFPFFMDKTDSINASVEYIEMLVFFLLICFAYSRNKYMDKYDQWMAEREARMRQFTAKNNLEITADFILGRLEKLYIVLLYVVALRAMNIVHTLILGFMTVFLLRQRFARKNFVAIIFLLCFRAVAQSIVLAGYLFDCPYPSQLIRAFSIIGIDLEYDSSHMVYKTNVTWELILLYFFSYIQLRTIAYIRDCHALNILPSTIPSQEAVPAGEEGVYVKFWAKLNSVLQKFLLWGIYVILFLVLAYQDATGFVVVISLLAVLIVATHVYGDLFYSGRKGYSKTVVPWYVLTVCNLLILLVSYFFSFAACTLDFEAFIQKDDEYFEILKAIGFDLVKPIGMQMHMKFFPQFIIVYLAYLARGYIRMQMRQDEAEKAKMLGQKNVQVEYKHGFWTISLILLDAVSKYSFHLLFFAAALLSVFWSLNIVMLIYLAIFAIHYSSLHLRFVQENSIRPSARLTFQQKADLTEREHTVQKLQATAQRRRTLKILCFLTCLVMVLSQAFRLVLVYKRYLDIFKFGAERATSLYKVSVLQAVGTYMGLMGVESPKAASFFTIFAGYLALLYLCVVESRLIDWFEDRMGYTFVKKSDKKPAVAALLAVIPEEKAEPLSKESSTSNYYVSVKAEKKARHKLTAMLLLNVIIEHAIVGGFLFSASLKNNVIAIAYIPVAAMCTCRTLSYRLSWVFSAYMWLCLFVQYFMCAANMDDKTSPQQHDDSIFLFVFHLSKWPAYLTWLEKWDVVHAWGRYFALGGSNDTRYSFVADAVLLVLQSLYFQHFCHTFYTLSSMSPKAARDSKRSSAGSNESGSSWKGEAGKEEKTGASSVIHFLYRFMQKTFFVYSHIFTLFLLLIVSAFSSGAIMILYLIFSVVFMQCDLFSSMGSPTWNLPVYTKFILKPYVLADIIVQFVFQIPYFPNLHIRIMPYAGIEDFSVSVFTILVKIVIFTLVIYQESIYASVQYRAVCRRELLKQQKIRSHRQLCMAYLNNNRRVYELLKQKYVREQNHARMRQVSSSIRRWNEILHRKGGPRSSEEEGLELDIKESKQKIKQIQRKLDGVGAHTYLALRHTGVLESVYLWLSDRINHIAFMKKSVLPELEGRLESGVSLVPNYVVDYRVSTYIELMQAKIEVERARLSRLEQRLSPPLSGRGRIDDKPSESSPAKKEDEEEVIPEVKAEETLAKAAPPGLPTLKLLGDILLMLGKLLYSSTEQICFAFMILAHAFNGNLLSLVYVLGMFCYAWLVRCRPHALYWRVMLLYAGIVIVIKYIALNAQDFFTNYFIATEGVKSQFELFFAALQTKCGARLGIFEGLKYGHMQFLLLDELVVMSIIFHLFVMYTLGIEKAHEEQVESLSQAVKRINEDTKIDEMKLIEEEKDSFGQLEAPELSKSEKEGEEGEDAKQTGNGFFRHPIVQHLFPRLRNEKPGKDYNDSTIIIQLLLCLYIIVFFSSMSFEVSALGQIEIKEFTVSTVVALLAQITFLLLDRYVYFHRPLPSAPRTVVGKEGKVQLEYYKRNNYALLGKVLLYLFQVVLVHFTVFWLLPNKGNVKLVGHPECEKEDIKIGLCNEPHANPFLMIFYVFYCAYFAVSAMQIRAGWPEMEEEEVHKEVGMKNELGMQIFFAIPFGWELQEIASWLWNKTSFNIFQWLKFEEIYSDLFLVNCSSKKRRQSPIGEEAGSGKKIAMGSCGLFLLLLLIVGPIFVFSALNPMVELNNPIRGSLVVDLGYGAGSSFELMRVANGDIQLATAKELEEKNVTGNMELRGKDLAQFRWISFPNTSDSNNFPTDTKRLHIRENIKSEILPKIAYTFSFVRPYPAQKQQVSMTFFQELRDEDISNLEKLFSYQIASIAIHLPSMFCSMFSLNLNEDPSQTIGCYENKRFIEDIALQLNMTYFTIANDARKVPMFSARTASRGLYILTVSEKSRSSVFANYSVLTLYISVILVIGRLIRGFISGSAQQIIYQEIPKPGPLLKLCSGVVIARYDDDLIQEGKLYMEIIEVMRSTELLKMITKSYKDVYCFAEKKKEEGNSGKIAEDASSLRLREASPHHA